MVLSPSHTCPLSPLQLRHLDPTCPEGNGLSEGQQGSEPPGWGCGGGLALAGPPWGSMRLWAAEVCRPQPPSSRCPSPRAPLKGEAPSGPLTRMFGFCVRPGPKTLLCTWRASWTDGAEASSPTLCRRKDRPLRGSGGSSQQAGTQGIRVPVGCRG